MIKKRLEIFSITDLQSPQERMVQVLRWYLSAFHAGRKSSIAKKPYNPILGEVFKCYWNVPGLDEAQVSSLHSRSTFASNFSFLSHLTCREKHQMVQSHGHQTLI